MSWRRAVGAVCLLVATGSHGGHGFMNSFADVEWLPEPGTTPDAWSYAFDRLQERATLVLAQSDEEVMTLAFEFAREKLAEASAMMRAGDAPAATRSLAHYEDYIGQAAAVVAAVPPGEDGEFRSRFIKAVLEHVYVMCVDYVDLPLGIRATVLAPFFAATMDHFAAQRAALSKGEQDALFFREEEIRWSLEMVEQADIQKITN